MRRKDSENCRIYVKERAKMEKYVPAEIEIVMIETEDVITASGVSPQSNLLGGDTYGVENETDFGELFKD
jgi:hypothetical protein